MQRCRDESSQVRLSQPLQQLLDPQLPRAFSLSNEDDGFGTSSCAPLSSTQHLSMISAVGQSTIRAGGSCAGQVCHNCTRCSFFALYCATGLASLAPPSCSSSRVHLWKSPTEGHGTSIIFTSILLARFPPCSCALYIFFNTRFTRTRLCKTSPAVARRTSPIDPHCGIFVNALRYHVYHHDDSLNFRR